MKRLTIRMTALLLVLVVVLGMMSGCGGTQSSSDQSSSNEKIVIRFSGTFAVDHPGTLAENKFAELMEKYSDGRVDVQVYPTNQLGSPREVHDMLQAGSLQMAESGAVTLANFTDKLLFTSLPFLFNSSEAAAHFLSGDVGQEISLAIAEETGIYPIAYFENGFQDVTNNVREIRVPEDMKGLKLRTQENSILVKIYESLGALPTPMALTELFTALQLGTVDGQVNPVLVADKNNYFEVQDYLTDVWAMYDPLSISISYDFYKSLPDDLREILHKSLNEARDYDLKLMAEQRDAAYAHMAEKGVKVTHLTDAEREAFRQATTGVYDWFRTQGLEPRLDELLTAVEKSNQLYLDGKLEPITGREIQ